MGRWLTVSLGAAVIALGACGDDENDETTAATTDTAAAESDALYEEIANLSDEEQIERVGEAWAEPFAAQDEAMCAYLHPDLGGATSCAAYVRGELIGSTKRQRSFAGTAVESVDVRGQTAVAEFERRADRLRAGPRGRVEGGRDTRAQGVTIDPRRSVKGV